MTIYGHFSIYFCLATALWGPPLKLSDIWNCLIMNCLIKRRFGCIIFCWLLLNIVNYKLVIFSPIFFFFFFLQKLELDTPWKLFHDRQVIFLRDNLHEIWSLIFWGETRAQAGQKPLTWIRLIMICYIVPWWPYWISDQITFSNSESASF